MTLRGGVFEKATVNFSKIESEFDPSFAHEIPGTEEHNRYQATGISVVLTSLEPSRTGNAFQYTLHENKH